MKYLHTMVRVTDIEQSLRFYRDALGLREIRRHDNEKGPLHPRLSRRAGRRRRAGRAHLQLDPQPYEGGRNFGASRLSRRRYLRRLREADGAWRHHQSPAARRQYGVRALSPTISRSNCSRPAIRCRPPNPGRRCPTRASGKPVPRAGPGDCAPRGPGTPRRRPASRRWRRPAVEPALLTCPLQLRGAAALLPRGGCPRFPA